MKELSSDGETFTWWCGDRGCRNHGPTVPFNRPGLLNGIRFFPDSEFPD